jgi:aconitase A
MNHSPLEGPKVVGFIDLSVFEKVTTTCAHCSTPINRMADSDEVTILHANGFKEVKYICTDCSNMEMG